MKNNANWANRSANRATIWANLRAIFALPKWLKIILGVLSIIAVVGIVGTLALNQSVKGETYSANLTLNSQKSLETSSQIAYNFWIDFPKFKPLLRSKSISRVDITQFLWDKHIDKNAIENLRNGGRNVWFESTQDLGALGIESLGKVEYTIGFSPLLWSVIRHFVWIVVIVLCGCVFWNSFKIYPFQTTATPITRKDLCFLGFAFALCFGIGAFTFWLGFPGYHIYWPTFINHNLDKLNWHPVIISYVLQFLYFIFGKHFYYAFLFNLIPFYLGIFFLIAGFYLRFKNPFAILLLFPTFIGNIYFQNFTLLSNINLAMFLFCIYSLLFFIILIPFNIMKRQKFLSKTLWSFLFVLMFFAILWRHNAIFSVFPAFFIIIYIFLANRNLDSKTFIRRYVTLTLLSAIVCVSVVIFIPKILATNESYPKNHIPLHQIQVGALPHSKLKNPSNHLFLHQIAGACVPADDSLCFKNEWYLPNKTFENVKITYYEYQLNADSLNFGSVTGNYPSPFGGGELKEIKQQWIKAILKYPLNYLNHEIRFFKSMWIQKPGHILDAIAIQHNKLDLDWMININNSFPKNERSVTFTPLQEQIYTFLYNHKILLNHIWGVGAGFIIWVISSVILWRRQKKVFVDNLHQNNALLVFCFSVSFASFWSAFFIAAFSPVPDSRYMSPILPMAIIALVGFVAFVLDCLSRKR